MTNFFNNYVILDEKCFCFEGTNFEVSAKIINNHVSHAINGIISHIKGNLTCVLFTDTESL